MATLAAGSAITCVCDAVRAEGAGNARDALAGSSSLDALRGCECDESVLQVWQERLSNTDALVLSGSQKLEVLAKGPSSYNISRLPDTPPNALSFQSTHHSANPSLHLTSGRATVRDLSPLQPNGLLS